MHCPQIRATHFEIPFDEGIDSFLDLSRHIVKQLSLEPHLKAIIYNKKGQPYFYNLDLMYMRLPKIDFSQPIYTVFTASSSVVDEEVLEPVTVGANPSKLTILKGK